MQTFELLMSLVIAIIIGLMATIKKSKIKAIIYGLPIPITVAFLTTNKVINSSHIIGLILLNFFIWFTYILHNKQNFPILFSDFVSALSYILISFPLLKIIKKFNFFSLAIIYLVLWVLFMLFIYLPKKGKEVKSKIPPLIKCLVILPIAYFLFKLKSLLQGVIVTFPFSGVFAVIESQDNLYTLATEFTKNSLGILILLVSLKISLPRLSLALSLLIGWIAYLIIFIIIQKFEDKIF